MLWMPWRPALKVSRAATAAQPRWVSGAAATSAKCETWGLCKPRLFGHPPFHIQDKIASGYYSIFIVNSINSKYVVLEIFTKGTAGFFIMFSFPQV